MTDRERLKILAEARRLGLHGAGGACGETAIAINELLFDGKGELVAAVNKYRWKQGYLTGHVGVRVKNSIWDYEGSFDGPEGLEEFMAAGMLDPDDPDWALPNEEAAYEVSLIHVTSEMLRSYLPFCGTVNPWTALQTAIQGKRKKG
jgi:hypothetical protein